jgi:hypothetical protein
MAVNPDSVVINGVEYVPKKPLEQSNFNKVVVSEVHYHYTLGQNNYQNQHVVSSLGLVIEPMPTFKIRPGDVLTIIKEKD